MLNADVECGEGRALWVTLTLKQGKIKRRFGGLQSNCIVSVAMGNSSDGDDDGRPSDMEVS